MSAVINLYQDTVEQFGRGPLFWMLVAILITFGATRIATRRIRAGAGGLKNWHIGGVHVHHQVFGVIAILVSGCLEFAYRPGAPARNILGALFGIGVSLTLDEFALWLHLDDVYWAPEGRKSIDAVFVAVLITGLLLIGVTPFDVFGQHTGLLASFEVGVLINLSLSIITLLKGKPIAGIAGLLLPFVALVGAIRLAKPASQWARWRYPQGSKKRNRATRRFDHPYQARWNRVRDLIGGKPDIPI